MNRRTQFGDSDASVGPKHGYSTTDRDTLATFMSDLSLTLTALRAPTTNPSAPRVSRKLPAIEREGWEDASVSMGVGQVHPD